MPVSKVTATPIRLFAVASATLAPVGIAADAFSVAMSGTFDGSLAGQSFGERAIRFTAVTDGIAVRAVFGEFHHPLSSPAVSFGGARHTVTKPATFFVPPLSGLADIADSSTSGGWWCGSATPPATPSMLTA